MALARRVLRVFLKRFRITLAVALRIARHLLSTFRDTRSTREFWSVSEVLIRSFIPEVQENIHGPLEEDGSSETASDRFSQPGIIDSVEGEMAENAAASDTIMTSDDEEENLMMLVQQDSTDSGECLSACTISGTVDVEEVFDRDIPEPINSAKGEITIDGLDLAASKERLAEKIMLMEQVVEFQPTAFLGLESCSTITSNGVASSQSDEFLAMIKSSSEESVDINHWEIRYDDIMITEVVELSSEGDVYRGSFNGETVTVFTWSHQYPLHHLIKDAVTIGKLDHCNVQKLAGYCCDVVKAVVMRNPGSITLHHVVYKMEVDVEQKVDMLHQVVCGLQYLKQNGLVLPWLCPKVVWLDNDLKRVCLELFNWEGVFKGKKSLDLSRLCFVPPEIVWQVCHTEYNFSYTVNGHGNVYQFGVLCYELLLGKLPLEGVSTEQAEQIISSGGFTIPESEHDPSISGEYAEMIQLCWNIDLWDRPTWEYILDVLRK